MKNSGGRPERCVWPSEGISGTKDFADWFDGIRLGVQVEIVWIWSQGDSVSAGSVKQIVSDIAAIASDEQSNIEILKELQKNQY